MRILFGIVSEIFFEILTPDIFFNNFKMYNKSHGISPRQLCPVHQLRLGEGVGTRFLNFSNHLIPSLTVGGGAESVVRSVIFP